MIRITVFLGLKGKHLLVICSSQIIAYEIPGHTAFFFFVVVSVSTEKGRFYPARTEYGKTIRS
jgi:hypothetical protein